MRKQLPLLATVLLFCSFTFQLSAQLSLTSSPYQQSFDGIGTGLPTGWEVRTGATASALGTTATPVTTATAWNSTSGNFRNVASANGLTSSSTSTEQSTSTNRALAVRQTGTFGDPGAAFYLQLQNTASKTGFKLNFQLQSLDITSPRTATWTVQFGVGTNPTSFTAAQSITGTLTTGTSTFTNNSIAVDFGSQLDNINDIVWIRIVAPAATSGSGNRPTSAIDNVDLSWSAGATPSISVTPASLAFGLVNVGANSASQSYTLGAANLTGDLNVSTSAPFSISADGTTFGTSLSFTPAQMASAKTVFVRYSPATAVQSTGTITHNSTGAEQLSVTVAGEGFDPASPSFSFNTCTVAGDPGSGFTQVSVTGAQLWSCTGFGRNSTNGIQMNGFSGGAVDNEDWLISPALNLSNGFNIPVLRFWSRTEFSGPPIQVLVSTNYSGSGNPNAATWTVLPAILPVQASNTWTLTDNLDLSAYKTSGVYIAFKYTSSTASGAARWTLDDVSISSVDRLIQVTPASLSFSEQAVGSTSTSQALQVIAKNVGDITLSVGSNWQLSSDNNVFGSTINMAAGNVAAGVTFYARYAPQAKVLRDTGRIRLQAIGIDSSVGVLLGTSFPRSQTLDIVGWNMMFFGSNSTNTATQPFKEQQKQNAKTVLNRLNADLIGFAEVSSDSLMTVLMSEMPGYATVTSPRWSYSYNPPDPNFPPQKVGFIYNSNALTLVESRPMFEAIYDAARGGSNTLPGYPTGTPSSFWASGRLPFMATFQASINGTTRTIRAVVIHGKSGGSTAEDYNRRMYDAKVLKDSLDAYYANDNVIIVGDYNDDALVSIYNAQPSPYKPFADDVADYNFITAGFTAAGKVSFLGSSSSMIDHHIVSNDLNSYYLQGSADVEDPRSYITNYTSTTSDHLPVYSRYALDQVLPVAMLGFQGWLDGNLAKLTWATSAEYNSSHFVVERSADGRNFVTVGKVAAAGNSQLRSNYQFNEPNLAPGTHYYRLRQVDRDGKEAFSQVVVLKYENIALIRVYPNPVQHTVSVAIPAGMKQAAWKIVSVDGRVVAAGQGNAENMVRSVQNRVPALNKGFYTLQVNSNQGVQTIKFLKE